MKKIIGLVLTAFILTEAASAAGSDASSGSATTSSSDRYGNSNKNVDIFSEVNSLISRSKFEEAHAKLAVMKAGANEADRVLSD